MKTVLFTVILRVHSNTTKKSMTYKEAVITVEVNPE